MAVELHNFIWEEVRLVQVKTLPRHIAGLVAEIRATLNHSNIQWEDIYSAYYECEEDGTVTFYEGESAEADNSGIWTYAVTDCALGEEEVVSNPEINPVTSSQQLRRLIEHAEEDLGEASESMQESAGLGQRLATLEQTVAELKHQLVSVAKPGNWIEKVIGSISDESALTEALEYGNAFRHSDRFVNEVRSWKERGSDNVLRFPWKDFTHKASG
jgi:DNA repair exonuclease SbcCD ATPase subunit